jgi:hypothetical protein
MGPPRTDYNATVPVNKPARFTVIFAIHNQSMYDPKYRDYAVVGFIPASDAEEALNKAKAKWPAIRNYLMVGESSAR